MADVVGGGTTNVTLYDEDGNPLGTAARPVMTLATTQSPDSLTQGTVTGPDATAAATGTPTDGSAVTHTQSGGDSSFSCSVRGVTGNYTFVFERSINAGLVAAADEVWTAVGAFQAGTPLAKTTWTQADMARAPMEFHGNVSSAARVRVRFTAKDTAGDVFVVLRSGRGTGTITIGNPVRIGDNNGNPLTLLATTPVGNEFALPIRNVNPFQTIRTPEEGKARNGQAFTSGTGQLTLTAAGNLRGTLTNPAGSGKSLYLYKLSVFSSSATGFARMRINPTSGLPTMLRPSNNNFIGHPTKAVGELRADTDLTTPLAGGADSGIEFAFASGETRETELPPFIVSPGLTLGLAVPFAGASTVIANVYWWEE